MRAQEASRLVHASNDRIVKTSVAWSTEPPVVVVAAFIGAAFRRLLSKLG